jgi:serine-type D-Ala-D-Ala carboxypeptidase (penicillin-binding protein 5/6)
MLIKKMKKRNKAKNNIKNFILFFFFSTLFWWGINTIQFELEDYIYEQKIAGWTNLQADVSSLSLPQNFKPVKENNVQALEITAESALAIYINPNEKEFILFEKNAETVRAIASLTKLVTALTVLDIYEPSDIIRISPEAVEQEDERGDLKVGEFISVEDLLKIMLIESSNDAAYSFASHHFSGGKMTPEAFRDLMNLEVKYNVGLNLENTFFQNPSGLDPYDNIEDINHSTAKDLFEIAKYIIREKPEILEIISYSQANAAGRHLETTNELLGIYPKIIGGKTGYTKRANGCLILLLEAPGENSYIINIILGSQDRFQDMKELIEWVNRSYRFRLN